MIDTPLTGRTGTRLIRRMAARAAALSASLIALTACALDAPFTASPAAPAPARSTETASTPDPSPSPALIGAPQTASEPEADESRLVYQRSRSGSRALSVGALDDSDFRTQSLGLDFVDAPARDVARAVIGEALGETVAVASGVTGRITLTAPEPAPVRAALRALEAVLAESGLALVEQGEGFLLTTAEAARSAGAAPGARLGFGARIIPVRHTGAGALLDLIDPFVTEQVTAEADDGAGILILTGPGPEVDAAAEAAALFDTPALTDRVYGLFELRYSEAQAVVSELNVVLPGVGAGPGAVTTAALPRLNQVFVATRDRARFEEVGEWIARFDQPAGGDERRLRYHPARNTPATTLARQITAAFAGSELAAGEAGLPRFAGDDAQPGAGGGEESSRLTVIADELNNGLIIRATDQEYREIVDLVERMDVMAPQVLIEATIAEVRLTDALDFGVRWFFQSEAGDGTNQFLLTDDEGGSTAPQTPGFSYAFVGTDINVALNALDAVTDVSVLSAPSIMVQNNQSADLQVGDEVPIVTQTAQAVGEAGAPIVSNVTLRETGVILRVTPRINASGIVVLDVTQEVSSVRPNNTSGIDSPTIQQLRFTSTVAARSGTTIALGGLIQESETTSSTGVPGLSRIPGIGAAFRARNDTVQRSELVIFLTPRIITTEGETQAAIESLRRDMGALRSRRPELFTQ
jgi:general secretion pathway protein D